ncbi:MAG: TIGR02996 domain-containing protein [Gemmataceae bacterium]
MSPSHPASIDYRALAREAADARSLRPAYDRLQKCQLIGRWCSFAEFEDTIERWWRRHEPDAADPPFGELVEAALARAILALDVEGLRQNPAVRDAVRANWVWFVDRLRLQAVPSILSAVRVTPQPAAVVALPAGLRDAVWLAETDGGYDLWVKLSDGLAVGRVGRGHCQVGLPAPAVFNPKTFRPRRWWQESSLVWLRFRAFGLVSFAYQFQPADPHHAFHPPTQVLRGYPAGAVVRLVPDDGPADEPRAPTGPVYNVWVDEVHSDDVVDVLDFPRHPETAAALWRRDVAEPGFWAAMEAAPVDALPRLVYADWLDERGDPFAGLLRADRPFVVHYAINENRRWVPTHRRPAGWTLAAAELQAFVAGGEDASLPLAIGDFNHLEMSRVADVSRGHPRMVQRQRLTVTLADATPAEPFVNYLLARMAGLILVEPGGP